MSQFLKLSIALLVCWLPHNVWAGDAYCPNGRYYNHTIDGSSPGVCMCDNGGAVFPGQYCPSPKRQEYWVTNYNAIAIDMTTKRGRTGYSHSEASQQIADQEALELCKLNTCQIVLRYINQCGSIAVSDIDRSIFGAGLGDTPQQAEDAALKDCIDKGGNQCGIWARGRCAGAYGYGNPHYR